jgi:prepilin-type N-terminal cleavage/methylation domain
MNRRAPRTQTGFTLIELIISITLLAVITGAMTAAFITTNNANANTAERIHESNDAQLTAGFWTADAQAAGGIDPSLGETDTTLGVLASTDDGGCSLGGGAKVVGFKWREWSARQDTANGTVDSFTTRVANYVYRSSTHELERRTCADTVSTGIVTLASRVVSLPVVTCDGSSPCPALPRRVTIAVTETNDPYTGPQYHFELTATVRSDSQTTRDSTNSESSPLLVLGGSCTAGAGFSVGGSTTMIVNGVAVIDATDGPGCTAMTVSGGAHGYGADGTSIAAGGSCGPDHCPAYTTTTSVGNPFASLVPPSTSGCGVGTNPARDGSGNFVPGTYPQVLNLSGSVLMNPGTYVLCNGISGSTTSRSSGVFLYVVGGTITDHLSFTAPTSGTYQSVGLWIATSTPWLLAGGASVNIGGAVYAPTTGIINNAGNASFTVSVLVALNVTFTGNSGVTITGTGTPRSPILTASTGSALRTVNLSWVPQTFPGMSPITSYEVRADRGAGVFGAWTAIAGGAATTSLVDTCGTSNTVATTCKYQVHAINAVGTGSPSNIAFTDSAFDNIAPAASITAPTNGGRTGLSTTITGTADNGVTDSATVVVSLFAGSNCTGAVQTFNVARTGTTWSVASGAMAAGPMSVCATQSDTAGNTGFAGPINFTAGQVTNLVVSNGGTAGRIDKGDTVAITFGQAMNPATLCTGWNGTTARKSSTVVVSITNNDAATGGDDSLTVTDTSCPTFNFGKIDLGSAAWVAGNTNFSGNNNNASSVVFDATLKTLTITLGTGSGSGTGVAAQTFVYTPSVAMKDSTGTVMTGTYSFINQRF